MDDARRHCVSSCCRYPPLAVVPAGVAGTQTAQDTLTVDEDGSAERLQAPAWQGYVVEVRPPPRTSPSATVLPSSHPSGRYWTVRGSSTEPSSRCRRSRRERHRITVRNYRFGVAANETSGDRTVTDRRYRCRSRCHAPNTAGNWTIEDAAVASTTYSGVFVRGTSGDWTIRDTRFVNVGGDGVDVRKSSGDWTVATVVVDRPAQTESTPPGQRRLDGPEHRGPPKQHRRQSHRQWRQLDGD
ncbi:hypothetical protein C8039_03180 [Halogeometricum sp. wsp3]|nr:hypothetical protein C8039_03180 [Halogeometricum sp. wsp3]